MNCVRCGTEMKVQSETAFQRRWVCPNPGCNSVADENTGLPKQGVALGITVLSAVGSADLLARDPAAEHPASGPCGDEPVSFTAEELRQMEADGLTLADAIRSIEVRPG